MVDNEVDSPEEVDGKDDGGIICVLDGMLVRIVSVLVEETEVASPITIVFVDVVNDDEKDVADDEDNPTVFVVALLKILIVVERAAKVDAAIVKFAKEPPAFVVGIVSA